MIGAYLKDNFIVLRHGTKDQYGSEGPGTEEPAKGLIEWKTRLMRSIQGEEVLSQASVLMAYDATLTHEDRLKLSGVEYPILAIEVLRDFAVRGMKVYI